MEKIVINDREYEILRNDNDCINMNELSEIITDYFYKYDYIVGDFAYDKIRLKGFYDSNSRNVSKINDYKNVDNYIKDYCSYGARIFILKKLQ